MINWKSNSPAKIAAIGECMIECREKWTGFKPVAGISREYSGDTLNALTYMARLLDRDSTELFYVTALGVDPDSAAMLAAWESEGINTAFVRRFRDKLPGSYTISTGPHGECRFSYDRDESAARALFRDDYAASLSDSLKGLKLLYLSGISVAILPPHDREMLLNLLQTLRRAGVIIVYDPNYRTALWASPREARDWAGRVYRETDVALPGFDDEKALFNDAAPEHACKRLADLGIAEVIMKNGSSLCLVTAGQGIVSFPVTFQDRVVDTTAAGDSFNAGYISARLCGHDIAASVRAGQILAGRVIQYPGAIIPREATPSLPETIK
ncbi:MAG: sugar kinase [Gammaproteobacteria bacterium]|nr:sugar kinase [Gammaproteobacteria bacterium]